MIQAPMLQHHDFSDVDKTVYDDLEPCRRSLRLKNVKIHFIQTVLYTQQQKKRENLLLLN